MPKIVYFDKVSAHVEGTFVTGEVMSFRNEERDHRRFESFTDALLKAGKRNPGVRGATKDLCEAIVRVHVSPPHRFGDAQSNLAASVRVLDDAIKHRLGPTVRLRVLKTAPSFLHDFRYAHEARLRHVCRGVALQAAKIWSSGRPSGHKSS